MQGQEFRPHSMRFEITLAGQALTSSPLIKELKAYLSVFKGFIVNLHKARNTKNASFINISCVLNSLKACSFSATSCVAGLKTDLNKHQQLSRDICLRRRTNYSLRTIRIMNG